MLGPCLEHSSNSAGVIGWGSGRISIYQHSHVCDLRSSDCKSLVWAPSVLNIHNSRSSSGSDVTAPWTTVAHPPARISFKLPSPVELVFRHPTSSGSSSKACSRLSPVDSRERYRWMWIGVSGGRLINQCPGNTVLGRAALLCSISPDMFSCLSYVSN